MDNNFNIIHLHNEIRVEVDSLSFYKRLMLALRILFYLKPLVIFKNPKISNFVNDHESETEGEDGRK